MKQKMSNRNNLTRFRSDVCREKREKQYGHKGGVIWFTGLSASGKSTLAHILEKQLHDRNCMVYVLDGDNVRHGLCKDLGFCPNDRSENIRRVGEIVKLFVDAGIIVITAFISPYRKDRDAIRRLFKRNEFMEVYLKCPLEVCAQRDKKGLYARAMSSEIPNFTGISAPYEVPENPDMTICTNKEAAMHAARKLIDALQKKEIIPTVPSGPLHSGEWAN